MLNARLQLRAQTLNDISDTLYCLVDVIHHALSDTLGGVFGNYGKHIDSPVRLLLTCDTLNLC